MDSTERTKGLAGALDRRDLLKLTTGAVGAAALARAGGRVGAAQEDGATLIFAAGTDIDELDPRTTDTQEGYIAAANIYDCLVMYEYGATTLRPGLAVQSASAGFALASRMLQGYWPSTRRSVRGKHLPPMVSFRRSTIAATAGR